MKGVHLTESASTSPSRWLLEYSLSVDTLFVLLVVLSLGSIDLLFALDSIPAIFVLQAMETSEVALINGGHPISWVPHVQTWHSLLVIVVAMSVAIAASLLTERTDQITK